jgi:hypothetical protein
MASYVFKGLRVEIGKLQKDSDGVKFHRVDIFVSSRSAEILASFHYDGSISEAKKYANSWINKALEVTRGGNMTWQHVKNAGVTLLGPLKEEIEGNPIQEKVEVTSASPLWSTW